jgi:hypothetical protein
MHAPLSETARNGTRRDEKSATSRPAEGEAFKERKSMRVGVRPQRGSGLASAATAAERCS